MVELADHHEVFAASQQVVDRRELAAQADHGTNPCCIVGDIVTEDLSTPGICSQERRQDTDQCGLAGTIWTEKCEHAS